ncbi:hypothetical protein PoB_002696600 [Plakobranchus ocellatus]|uniref:Uncharacterized protein n=1 Tax=Plakobranchus ocellatus TaxID=259542 RepID=A0AAV3ZMY9_9GAST|nr:hypothetical protein PoB_002696600 [Plakobranchus ocellatus]
MLPVKYIAAILGIVVFCAGQSDGQTVSTVTSIVRSIGNEADFPGCDTSASGCEDTYLLRVPSSIFLTFSNACPLLNDFANCFVSACNLNSRGRNRVFSSIQTSLAFNGIVCDLDNGQQSIQKSGPAFIVMALLTTFVSFFFRFN